MTQPVTNQVDHPFKRLTFESIEEVESAMMPLMNAIAGAVGSNCEIVLHDLSSRDLSHTVASIVNGHVSGREVGGPSTNLGIEVLKDENTDHDEFGYAAQTADGREFRSSSVYFRNRAGQVIAAFCINYDLTPLQKVRTAISEILPNSTESEPTPARELIATNIDAVLDAMITEAIAETGKPPALMSKQNRLTVLKKLDLQGAFHVKRSMDIAAKRIGVSRVTAYSYLDEIRNSDEQSAI
jgi:predicted transcriptional regulator YheO